MTDPKPSPDKQLGWSAGMLSGALKLLDQVYVDEPHDASEIDRAKQMLTIVNRKMMAKLLGPEGVPNGHNTH